MSYEQPDTLRSKAYYRFLDLVSEGQIRGLVAGLESIYLDDTPLINSNGVMNFNGVNVDYRMGTSGQSPVNGFGQVENTVTVNTEIKASAPVVRTFTNTNIDSVRLTIGIPALYFQNLENGDTYGSSVGIMVDVQSGGSGWVPQIIGTEYASMNWVSSKLTHGGQSTTFRISVKWQRGSAVTAGYGQYNKPKSCGFVLQYRTVGASTWTTYTTGEVTTPNEMDLAKGSTTVDVSLPNGSYEFQVVKSNGSIYGTLSLAGTYLVPSYTYTVSGKTTSRYQFDIDVRLSGTGPWDIRVRRNTADSTTSNLQNKTWLDATTEVIEAKLRYPHSAYFALSVDASQFSTVPTRSYHLRGIEVQVPTNYDPISRVYSGPWNGTFKTAWTNNPAWCFYDLLTNKRYGLGEFIPESHVDKWSLYTIAQYCDELVDDGFGNAEPRFTCNLYLASRAEAFKVINDFASIFRGLVYWASSSITAVQDAPSDPAYLYTPANVIDGVFNYMGSSAKARHTVALVAWNDPDDMYRQKVEYVEDAAGIARYGVIQTEVVAFGCTSRGQANRVGRWLLFTERLQSEVVTFKTGLDGNLCRPGQIIKVADPTRAGVRFGGRLAAATASQITLDAPVTLQAGQTYTASTLRADGTVQESTVTTAAGTTSVITVSPAFPEAPAIGSIWLLASTAVEAQQFRVISVNENSQAEFEITALAHDPDKFDAVENGLALQPRSISVLSVKPSPPTNGTISEYLYEAATDLKTMVTFGWDAVEGAQYYEVKYSRNNGNFFELPVTGTNTALLQDAAPGAYRVSVIAVSGLGYKSAPLLYTGEVLGKVAPPADVSGLQLQVQTGTGLLSWDTHPDLDVKLGGKIVIRHSTATSGATWRTSVPIAEFSGASTSGTVPLLAGTYLAKAQDTSGSLSVNSVSVTTNVPSVLQYNVVVTSEQGPAFAGAKTNMEVAAGKLLLASSLFFDDITDLDALVGSFDGGTVPSGSYEFDDPIDLGAVYSCRVTTAIGVSSYDTSNVVDSWTSVDGVSDIDGTIAADSADVRLYISTTLDDPAGAPTWTAPKLFTVGDYQARGYRFSLAVARGATETQQVAIGPLAVTIDVPDRVEGKNNVTVPAGGMRVSFDAEFFTTPAIAVTGENMATGDYVTLTNKDATGFDVRFYNSSGTGVSRTMDWIAKGYGFKTP